MTQTPTSTTSTTAGELGQRLLTAAKTGKVETVSRTVVDALDDRFEVVLNGEVLSVLDRTGAEAAHTNEMALFHAAVPDHRIVESLSFGEGHHVALLLRHSGTANGTPYKYSHFHLYTLNDEGRIVRLEEFYDPADMAPMLEAWGPLAAEHGMEETLDKLKPASTKD